MELGMRFRLHLGTLDGIGNEIGIERVCIIIILFVILLMSLINLITDLDNTIRESF